MDSLGIFKLLILLDILLFWLRFFSSSQLFECFKELELPTTPHKTSKLFHRFQQALGSSHSLLGLSYVFVVR